MQRVAPTPVNWPALAGAVVAAPMALAAPGLLADNVPRGLGQFLYLVAAGVIVGLPAYVLAGVPAFTVLVRDSARAGKRDDYPITGFVGAALVANLMFLPLGICILWVLGPDALGISRIPFGNVPMIMIYYTLLGLLWAPVLGLLVGLFNRWFSRGMGLYGESMT